MHTEANERAAPREWPSEWKSKLHLLFIKSWLSRLMAIKSARTMLKTIAANIHSKSDSFIQRDIQFIYAPIPTSTMSLSWQ